MKINLRYQMKKLIRKLKKKKNRIELNFSNKEPKMLRISKPIEKLKKN